MAKNGPFPVFQKKNILWNMVTCPKMFQWSWVLHCLFNSTRNTFSENFKSFGQELQSLGGKNVKNWLQLALLIFCTLDNHQEFVKSFCAFDHMKISLVSLCNWILSFVQQIFSMLCQQTFCQEAQKWSILHLLTPTEDTYLTTLKKTKTLFLTLRHNFSTCSKANTL